MIIFFVLVCVTPLLVFVGVFALLEYRRKPERRGFQVKLNTGDEPVIEKKENDHG